MVTTGPMEDGDEIGETDEEKIQWVVKATGYQGNIDITT